jgi:hypothetical protein
VSSWPRGRWSHAGIAFWAAIVAAIVADRIVYKIRLAQYVRDFPHDGQDGLAAFIEGLPAGAAVFVAGFIVMYLVQRALASGAGEDDL